MSIESLVSVIVPCYNHEKYVEQCILSIVNQTYKNVQLIVIDDGSKDKSFEIIEALSKQYHFIAESQSNMGLSKTLNKAIKKYATGEWICLLASDDVWSENKLQLQVEFANTHPEYTLVCGKAKYLDKNGTIGAEVNFWGSNPYHDYSFENIFITNQIIALTAMFKHSAWQHVGGFDEDSFIEDWDFWLSLSQQYKIGFQNEYLGYWRLHGANSSDNQLKMAVAKIHVINKRKNHPLYKKAYEKHFLENIRNTARHHKGETLKNMLKHLKYLNKAAFIKALIKVLVLWK